MFNFGGGSGNFHQTYNSSPFPPLTFSLSFPDAICASKTWYQPSSRTHLGNTCWRCSKCISMNMAKFHNHHHHHHRRRHRHNHHHHHLTLILVLHLHCHEHQRWHQNELLARITGCEMFQASNWNLQFESITCTNSQTYQNQIVYHLCVFCSKKNLNSQIKMVPWLQNPH